MAEKGKIKPLSLRLNFLWTFIGNAIYAGSQWGMLIALAKLGSPEMVGQFALGLAITAPVIFFTNISLRAIQVTDVKDEYKLNDYLSLRLFSSFIGFFVIAGIALFAKYSWQVAMIIIIIGAAKVVESIIDIFHGFLQRYERLDRIALSLMFRGPLSLICLAFFTWLTGEVLWGVLSLFAAWAFILLTYDLHNVLQLLKNINSADSAAYEREFWSNLRPHWQLKKLSKLIILALPMGFVAMLVSLNGNIPRYFIEATRGSRELGIYAALSYLMTAGGMIISALDKSATPRQASYYASGNKKAFIQLIMKLISLALFIGIGGILISLVCGKQLLTIIYSPEYAEHVQAFILLMVAAGISYINHFLGASMTASRHFRIQLPIFVVINLVLVLFCYLLIPPFGIQGAAVAVILAQLVQMFLSSLVIFHAVRRLA